MKKLEINYNTNVKKIKQLNIKVTKLKLDIILSERQLAKKVTVPQTQRTSARINPSKLYLPMTNTVQYCLDWGAD